MYHLKGTVIDMITVKDSKKYLDKDTKFEGVDEFVVIDRITHEIYCAYKCMMESSIDKGYIVVYSDGKVSYETLGKGATMCQVFKWDDFYAYSCRDIEINADVLVTY